MTIMAWFDSKEGIQEAIDKGIGGLAELVKARREARDDDKTPMTEWVLFGYFFLSTNGGFSKIIRNAPREHPKGWKLGDVAYASEAETIVGKDWSWESTAADLPPIVGKCKRCLYGWDKRNITDYHERHGQDAPHIHETCYKLQAIDDEIEFFQDVLKASEMPHTGLRIIPNEYHSGLYFNPWFIIESKWGPIRIGWRKRVINIDWSDSSIKTDGTVLFKEVCDKGITCWETGIHAYGKDKAVEHLRDLARAQG